MLIKVIFKQFKYIFVMNVPEIYLNQHKQRRH